MNPEAKVSTEDARPAAWRPFAGEALAWIARRPEQELPRCPRPAPGDREGLALRCQREDLLTRSSQPPSGGVSGRRWASCVLVVGALTSTVVACATDSRYEDPGPPTGEGPQVAIRLLIILFLPSCAIATGLLWHHFKARPRTGRSPGFVWIAIGWFFASAALVGLPGVFGLIGLIHDAIFGSSTLGEERRFVDFAGVGAFIVGISLGGALLLVAVALSLLRGTPGSRWVAVTCSTLAASACVALAAVGAGQGNATLFLVALVLALGAAVPLPFLFRLGATDHFSTGSPTT